jgi:hypothetical protein
MDSHSTATSTATDPRDGWVGVTLLRRTLMSGQRAADTQHCSLTGFWPYGPIPIDLPCPVPVRLSGAPQLHSTPCMFPASHASSRFQRRATFITAAPTKYPRTSRTKELACSRTANFNLLQFLHYHVKFMYRDGMSFTVAL